MNRLNHDEEELVYQLASELTGTHQSGAARHDVIITNVSRRLSATGAKTLVHYLETVNKSPNEFEKFLSAVTIHTTSWFREMPHFEVLEERLLRDESMLSGMTFRLLCAAYSTGQEVYSFALLLESLRLKIPGFNYEVTGLDVDPVSVSTSRKAIYKLQDLSSIPQHFRKGLLQGSGSTEGLMTLSPQIRQRCTFSVSDLRSIGQHGGTQYDQIVCRNVLIYFTPTEIDKIIVQMAELLKPAGVLCLGHSEAVDGAKFNLRGLGHTYYAKLNSNGDVAAVGDGRSRKILIVDDSATVRKTVRQVLAKDDFVVSEAASADEATAFLKNNKVDLITLDLSMPGIDGQTWLRSQRAEGLRIPVVILSGASPQEAMGVLGALENGAQDFIEKSILHRQKDELLGRVRAIIEGVSSRSKASPQKRRRSNDEILIPHPDLIVIGASTGGTEVLGRMMRRFPKPSPPILIVQHITPSFARPFAERIAEVSGLTLVQPVDGTRLEQNSLYMAFSDQHIGVRERANGLFLVVSDSPAVNRHKPSVDFLFRSVALLTNKKITAVLLTGMGADGAAGLLELKTRNATTIAQDEASCVVFGMPNAAIKLGAVGHIADPEEIRVMIERAVRAE